MGLRNRLDRLGEVKDILPLPGIKQPFISIPVLSRHCVMPHVSVLKRSKTQTLVKYSLGFLRSDKTATAYKPLLSRNLTIRYGDVKELFLPIYSSLNITLLTSTVPSNVVSQDT